MRNLAYAILDGNLTADPEIKTVGNGKKVSTFSLAVNHDYKDDDSGAANNDVSYIDIEAWDKVAENCSEFLKKKGDDSRKHQTRQMEISRWSK